MELCNPNYVRRIVWVMSIFVTSLNSWGATSNSYTIKKPNILMLLVEDMSARVGAFGDTVAVTPNLDKLATESVKYPNTFTTAGVCSPSRAALMMGALQTEFGAQHMRTGNYPGGEYKTVPPANMKAFPELLRKAGYQTFTNGKLDYQFSGIWLETGPLSIWDVESNDAHWRGLEQDKPFFGLVNLMTPHETGMFSPLGSWPSSRMHLIVQLVRAWQYGIPPEHFPVKPNEVVLEPYYPDIPSVREEITRHYNNITIMDNKVGQLLTKLKEDNLLDSTIIIWTTDHGDGLPRAKRDLYDSGIKVPMMIRWPKQYRPTNVKPNTIDTRLISFVDLAPTILKLAGVDTPTYMKGTNFTSDTNQRRYIYAARDRMGQTPDKQRAIRDDRFKYIYSDYPDLAAGHKLDFRDNLAMIKDMREMFNKGELNPQQARWFLPVGKEQFYDLTQDPYELNNLANDPNFNADLQRFRLELQGWQQSTIDYSDKPELQMRGEFLNNDVSYITTKPALEVLNSKVNIASDTEGASIEYRINGKHWLLYSLPIDIAENDEVEARAIRYGFEPSEVASITIE